MEIRKWLENLKKEKKRKKLVQAAKELEAKADPSLPKIGRASCRERVCQYV